ncbi:hypothetical protein N7516_007159 [Penicillium verrucosum]|uniref:uncharacterized protein n=1 Tax=Penicillium verrucosum TaxID=60171 RepID=UPI002544F25B|nr:uncharacterized protein N7516_007159 [Penicillium verrucosum]KAJ5932670.1 hypothetical protein N7516_007159 [Penicillium verrucosum]
MTGNPTLSMSAQNLWALLVQTMRPSRDPSQPALDPRAVYGTTTYNNTPFQLGRHHPSHIPIRDTRPQMIPYASHLQPEYPEFPNLGYDPFPSPPPGLEEYTAAQLSALENSFRGLQSPSDPVDSTGPIQPEELVSPTHVHCKGILPGHHKSGETQPSTSFPSKTNRPQTPSPHVLTRDSTSGLADMDCDSEPRTESELEPASESEKRVAYQSTNQKRSRSQTSDPIPNKKVRSAPDPTPTEPARARWKEICTRSVSKHPDLMRHLEQRETDPVYRYYHEIMDTSSKQSSWHWDWKTEKDLPADLKGMEKERLTHKQIETLLFFKPTIRKKYETAFRWRGQIRTEYAHLLETVENGRFKLPVQLVHSCNPWLVGQYLFCKVSSENPSSRQITLSPAKSSAIHPELASPPIPAQSPQVPGSTQNDVTMPVLLHEWRMTQRGRNNQSSVNQTLSAMLTVQCAEVTALRDRIQSYDTLLEDHPALQSQVKKWSPLPQPTPMSTFFLPKALSGTRVHSRTPSSNHS